MRLIQMTYSSRPFGFDAPTLSAILLDARRANLRDDISGALIARADIYLQLLEGPETMVNAAYERIVRDNRHLEVKPLYSRPVAARMFGGWAMRDDPVRSWMWSLEEVANGAAERATSTQVQAVFARLASEPAH